MKKRQADDAAAICLAVGFSEEEAEEVRRLIRKEDLKSNEETQVRYLDWDGGGWVWEGVG